MFVYVCERSGAAAGQLALRGLSRLRGPARPFAVVRKAGENIVGGLQKSNTTAPLM